jgi:hypothetical protein
MESGASARRDRLPPQASLIAVIRPTPLVADRTAEVDFPAFELVDRRMEVGAHEVERWQGEGEPVGPGVGVDRPASSCSRADTTLACMSTAVAIAVAAATGLVLGIVVSLTTDLPLAPEVGLVLGALVGWLARRKRT